MHNEAMTGRSKVFDQQVDAIDTLLSTACNLLRHIRDTNCPPGSAADQSCQSFQTVICSVHHLIRELEDNPLYRPALLQLCDRQKRQRQLVIEKYFGSGRANSLDPTGARSSQQDGCQ